ncbi:MAG: histidinol-phosphatase HisJ family protein [Erysipelotrichaceae bacterium]|jgi:histidinol-phosphatase (PHP family)|nr:histidinol-phosphatase HisJ family protein [Bacillota bacterium]
MIDGHIHLENGPLTIEYLEKFIDVAIKKDIKCIQILDHTHRFIEFRPIYENVKNAAKVQEEWFLKKSKDSIEDYLKLIKLAKEKEYPIEVKFGLEVCYTSQKDEETRNILNNYKDKFDFIVGAVHSVYGLLYDMEKFSRELLWNVYDTDDIYKEYYNQIIKLMESDMFTQVAHPDTIKLFNIYPTYDLTKTYNKIADLALEKDLYLENNFGCYYRYNHKDPGLSKELKELLLNKGVKIMLASDAHIPEHVGQCFELWTN